MLPGRMLLVSLAAVCGCSQAAPNGSDSGPVGADAGSGLDADLPESARALPPELVAENLADPDVLRVREDLYWLSGTGTGTELPLFRSSDLESFTLDHSYAPSAIDPDFDYCFLWAPDLSKSDTGFDLYFSAHRVAKGAACPATGQEVATFHATAVDDALDFGKPALVNEGSSAPHTRIASGCPAEGCNRAIRIDAAVFGDGAERRLFYTWFDGGNNISSISLADPGTIIDHTGPAISTLAAAEEGINEGAEILQRDGRYYLFFSSASYDSGYAMSYIMADSIAELSRERAARPLSARVRRRDGEWATNAGHNSIVERDGAYWNFYHVGVFNSAGQLTARHTYRQRLRFRDDGSLQSANAVTLRWLKVPGEKYSLDVVTTDGRVIGPCISATILGGSTRAEFTGVCPSAGDELVHKADVAAFRLYHSATGTWSEFEEQDFDGAASDLTFVPPDGEASYTSVTWNELATGSAYSLDVQLADGSWIAPCVSAGVLHRNLAHDFTGACTSANREVALADVTNFRVCSAINNDWAHATCGSAPANPKAMLVEVAIP